jgi:predicted site-specific integrase-resolvase
MQTILYGQTGLISRRQAAEMLAVTPKTICRYERAGRLLLIKLSYRVTRYNRDQVLKLIADGTEQTGGAC